MRIIDTSGRDKKNKRNNRTKDVFLNRIHKIEAIIFQKQQMH